VEVQCLAKGGSEHPGTAEDPLLTATKRAREDVHKADAAGLCPSRLNNGRAIIDDSFVKFDESMEAIDRSPIP
jgi:hypothetical protein